METFAHIEQTGETEKAEQSKKNHIPKSQHTIQCPKKHLLYKSIQRIGRSVDMYFNVHTWD